MEFAECYQWIAKTEALADEWDAVVAKPWKKKALKRRRTVVVVAAVVNDAAAVGQDETGL